MLINKVRHGSNARDSSSAPARSSPVILSAAKDLSADRDRPFAEFTLSEANGLRVTRGDCSNGQGQFVQIEPCLKNIICIKKLIQQASKKYGANAPQLHHISFAPAWGAIPDQATREKPKKIRRKCATVAPYFISIKNQPRKNKKIRRKCATVAPYFMSIKNQPRKRKKIRRKCATVAPYLSGGKPTRQSPAVGIARSILLYSCIQQNQPVPFV
jgi:hypothetical protein